MRFTEYLSLEENVKDVAKKSAAHAQAVWAEKDLEKKKAKAAGFINNMAFKDKVAANLRKLEAMNNVNKIDKFIGDIQLKGEGQGVV